ncbi:MAG: T9SS type A sorting domain-containing protein [Saprospiraceae bacterium]|nr:T9SS type A sorting domain-containing protein [Saprospiraceae bacterium]
MIFCILIQVKKIFSIIIYNEMGQEIKRVNSVSENKIDLSNLKSGLYIIKFLNMNNEKIVKKVLKN